VAADALFLSLNERLDSETADKTPFPLIQGILTFDTPYNGLARSMFVYGAFSNYQKVSNVFNVMTALGAAAPAGLRSLATQRATRSAAVSAASRSNPAWKTWQLVAVRTGTVGAIAAGGVAAYVHREAIMKGMQKVKNINRDTVADGYRQSNDTQRLLLDQRDDSRTGERRPGPIQAPAQVVAPGVRGVGSAALPEPVAPAPAPVKQTAVPARSAAVSKTSAAPGFSF